MFSKLFISTLFSFLLLVAPAHALDDQTYVTLQVGGAESDFSYGIGIGRKINESISAEAMLQHLTTFTQATPKELCALVRVGGKPVLRCTQFETYSDDNVDGVSLQAKVAVMKRRPYALYGVVGLFISPDAAHPQLGLGIQRSAYRVEYKAVFDVDNYGTSETVNSLSVVVELR